MSEDFDSRNPALGRVCGNCPTRTEDGRADRGRRGIVNTVTGTRLLCQDCGALIEGGNEEPLYECCETFTRSNSADGEGHRCPSCNKFAAKVSDLGCPDCGVGELEEIEVAECAECGEEIEAEEMPEHLVKHTTQLSDTADVEAELLPAGPCPGSGAVAADIGSLRGMPAAICPDCLAVVLVSFDTHSTQRFDRHYRNAEPAAAARRPGG